MRRFALRELIELSRCPAQTAAREIHGELCTRLKAQADVTKAIGQVHKKSHPRVQSVIRTLDLLVNGVARELDLIAPLLTQPKLIDQYHRELFKTESRYGTVMSTVVDILQELTDEHRPTCEALETLVRADLGILLLLRNQLQAHAGHLENLPQRQSKEASGVVNESCDLHELVLDATTDVYTLASHATDHIPDFIIQSGLSASPTVIALPHQLSHVLLELLKNATSAHLKTNQNQAPICIDFHSSALHITDHGGGISVKDPIDTLARLKPGKRYDRTDVQTSYAAVPDPLAGLNVGLFVARVHAEQFYPGALSLKSHNSSQDSARSGLTATIRIFESLEAIEQIPDLDQARDRLLSSI